MLYISAHLNFPEISKHLQDIYVTVMIVTVIRGYLRKFIFLQGLL